MNDLRLTATGVTHQLYASMLRARRTTEVDHDRDRGAVSLEQVLWFVAAGVAVAVIAGILFQRITDEVDQAPINTAPTPTP